MKCITHQVSRFRARWKKDSLGRDQGLLDWSVTGACGFEAESYVNAFVGAEGKVKNLK